MNSPFKKISDKENFLEPEEFFDEFSRSWDAMTGSFFKFESLQEYSEDPGCGMSSFLAGKFPKFAKEMVKARLEEADIYAKAVNKGVDLYRLRSYRVPLSEYVKFEYYTYLVSEHLGESIRAIDEKSLLSTTGFEIPDLVVFDDSTVFQYVYKSTEPVGGYISRDPSLARSVDELLRGAFERGSDFRNMMPADERIARLVNDELPSR